jgi:uncharacterized protein YrzB (UPF0473 family)
MSLIAMERFKKLFFAAIAVGSVLLSYNLNAQVIPGSVIADDNDEQVLKEWLGGSAAGRLLYRKSESGADAATFHELCDDKAPTIVLIKASNGNVFGGYATESWSSPSEGKHKSAEGSFLFNLTTDRKGDLKDLSYGIYNDINKGPTFGAGFDLYINSSMSGGHVRNSSYASLDGSPKGSIKANKALIGDDADAEIYMFSPGFIQEIEVYEIYNGSEPIIVAQDLVVQLDENGQAIITAEQVDNGTSDADGPVSLSIHKASFSCSDLPGGSEAVPITSAGKRSQFTHSYGGGFNPNVNEFLYPEWSGSTVHRYNSSGEYLDSFNSGQNGGIIQLWMDMDSEDYYTANWSDKTITRRNTSGIIWSYSLRNSAGGVATDKTYAYAIEDDGRQVIVLDKNTGEFVKNISLPGAISINGGMVFANEKIYLAGKARFGTHSSTWNAIHVIEASSGEYQGSQSIAVSTVNGLAFDGENIWLSDGKNSIYGYQVSNGNAYSNNGIHNVTLTAIDPLGNIATKTVKVTVEDNIAPSISLLGDETMKIILGNEFTDPGVSAEDNCSVITVTVSGDEVDINTPGTYIIKYSAIDKSGNSSEITRIVEVSVDSPPTAIAQDITIELDETGNAVITPDQVDNGSSDNEGDVTLELDITTFDCSAVGIPQTVTLTVTDETGNSTSAPAIVTVEDIISPEVITRNVTVQLDKDGTATITASAIDHDSSDACGIASLSLDKTSFNCENVGENTVTLTVTDNNGNESAGTAIVTVVNEAPVISSIFLPEDPIQVGVPVNASASFTDINARSANWYWGDGATTKGTISGADITGDHIYEVPGIYTVTAEVIDICGQSGTKQYQYVIITDPDAGFVTGGGIINSPVGAYTANPSMNGKAEFEYVIKYNKDGASLKGNINFRFKPASFKFSGTSYDWLVVNGDEAFFKGKGVVNGNTNVEFIAAMVQGQGKNDPAKFRIRILNAADGSVIYDNQVSDGIDAVAANDITAGAIKIHVNNKKSKNARIASNEQSKAEIHMFPNPVIERLNISLSNSDTDKASYKVVDLQGNILIDHAGGNTITLDVNNLDVGMYLLIIETNGQIIRERFMKVN